jgi:hypothetical protein
MLSYIIKIYILVATSKNSPCEDDAQCSEAFLLGSYCGESQRCDCYPGYQFKNNLCLRANEVGEFF